MDFRQRRRVVLGDSALQPPLQASPAVTRARSATGSAAQLRRPRHAGFLRAMHQLDAAVDPAQRAQLAEWLSDAYVEEVGDLPLGCLAQCYLGPPYVDHRLDLGRAIVEHYAPTDPVPDPFAQARMLVRTGAYAYVEIYMSGTIVPVRNDGSVVA
ncbi:hypothetical protein [Dactylosporangium sp. CA-139066]|uniref:hypothetical protein n=1 Tax=Dactylosporangium sp. CA-139066 TaxID=3239930 RepID=UPI003D93DF9C